MKSLSVLGSGMGGVAVAHALAYGHDSFDVASYAKNDIIRRDVAVVGGSATETYAAIKLGDMDKSVVLVERSGRPGGEEETYTDPTTGTKVDYGVAAYYNNSVVTDFFERFEAPLVKFSISSNAIPVFADFATGTLLQTSLRRLSMRSMSQNSTNTRISTTATTYQILYPRIYS
jgi:2-polyprenyl-6-methoxyphenol hydroxylase-like FAD-dependent oxidoreductase